MSIITFSKDNTVTGIFPSRMAAGKAKVDMHRTVEVNGEIAEKDLTDAFNFAAKANVKRQRNRAKAFDTIKKYLETDFTADASPAAQPKPRAQAPASAGEIKRPKEGSVCARVWDIADRHSDLARGDVVELCVKDGINVATARTQYQRWFKANTK